MSNPDSQSQETTPIPVFTEVPADLALKQKLGETAACETWDAFDRPKKKKYIFKRLKKPFCGDVAAFERFRNDLFTWENLHQSGIALPGITKVGSDADGIWYAREPVAVRSLAEIIGSGKAMREHDVARRFVVVAELLFKLHGVGLLHRNLKPSNVFSNGPDDVVLVDADFGYFRDPACVIGDYDPAALGAIDFLAPEQRQKTDGAKPLDARTDLWSLAALMVYALTGKVPSEITPEAIPGNFRALIVSTLKENPDERLTTPSEFLAELEQIVKVTRPSAFGDVETAPIPTPSQAAVAPASTPVIASSVSPQMSVQTPISIEQLPVGTVCPQCHTPVRSANDRMCPQCGRPYLEPCLNCQSMNPFWIRVCRGCGSDLLALKQQMLVTLNNQKQQILKLRETYGHDKTLPLLKYMSTVNHPDFLAFKEWAKSMTALVHKERREIRAYVDNVRTQANAAMEAQKYDKVQQILEKVPRPLLDEPMRKQYVDAGDALTEVDSLIREIRNAIATKQYSPLLSCVQRYLELKANDPEAQNLQQKIEKLTTITSPKGMKLRRIPSGRFYMGSHDSDEYLRNNEHPQHRVQITRNLFVGVYPVTQLEFLQLMEFNPSVATDNEQCPADSVTWFSAVEFCNKMSDVEQLPHYYELKNIKRRNTGSIETAVVTTLGGDGYRLLTEAEWEYTCRAGSITPWCFGDQVMDVGDYAWYYDNSTMETHPVGEKKPNAWGLFDMHGNVMEWCHDWYGEFYYQQCPDEEENPVGPDGGSSKVLRGGAWQFGVEATRCAYRNSSAPEATSSVIGFRVCRNATDDVM